MKVELWEKKSPKISLEEAGSMRLQENVKK